MKRMILMLALAGCGGDDNGLVDCEFGRCDPQCVDFIQGDLNMRCTGHNDVEGDIECMSVLDFGVGNGGRGCCVITDEGQPGNNSDDTFRWFECEAE